MEVGGEVEAQEMTQQNEKATRCSFCGKSRAPAMITWEHGVICSNCVKTFYEELHSTKNRRIYEVRR